MSLNKQIKETVELAREISSTRFAAFGCKTSAQVEAEEKAEQELIAAQGLWLSKNGKYENGKWTAESIEAMTKAFSPAR